jgi:hypothetical protein
MELNTPRQGRHSKDDRIERLEPDIREGRFYLPCLAYHPDHGADCYWAVWNQEMADRAAKKGEKLDYRINQIVYWKMQGATRRKARASARTAPPLWSLEWTRAATNIFSTEYATA